MFFSLAWRNIWRIPRRTLIILIAVISGVWAMMFMDAFMCGMMDQLIDNSINTLTGHIQIHQQGYIDDPVIEQSMIKPDNVYNKLENLPDGTKWAKRIRVPGIISNARNSAGITIVGIEPDEEAELSFIKSSITEGKYLTDKDEYGILVGRKLAEKFETGVGKKLVLMSQDSSDEIASGGFRIIGIYETELETSEDMFAFIILSSAQKMLKLKDGISEISILLSDKKNVIDVQQKLISQLPESYEVLNWEELLPLVKAYLSLWKTSMIIWFLVIFIAMAFGLVNTMLMAVFERIREFGMLKAIGMKPRWIITQVIIESFCLLVIGIIIGDIISWLTIDYFAVTGINLSAWAEGAEHFNMSRIVYLSFNLNDLIIANLVVLILGLIVCLYPALKASRIVPVKALAYT